MKIEVNKIMNPAFLFGTAFNIAYWHRKYHSGTICKGYGKENKIIIRKTTITKEKTTKKKSNKKMKEM